VRRSGTGPEMALRRVLFAAGLRFRLRARMKLPTAPDLVFPRARVAVFVDGCFWHGCPLHASWPKMHKEFWARKIRRNRERDRSADAALAALGWLPLRFWEHEVKKDVAGCVERVTEAVRLRR
jgi:DNA mismatch endonuclease, patch repair protein